MKTISALIVLLMLSAPLIGCLGEQGNEVEADTGGGEGFGSFSVVAPIDTGINVYHDHFVMNESYPQWLLDQLGVNMVCNITTNGTWQDRYEADRESCWDVSGLEGLGLSGPHPMMKQKYQFWMTLVMDMEQQ